MEAERIIIFPDESIAKRYSIRFAARGGKTVEACFPYEAVEREARRKRLSIKEFMRSYEAEFLYNNFGGVHVRFVPKLTLPTN